VAELGEDEEEEVLTGIDKLSRHLEIERLFENLLERADRRLARQRRTEEVNRGRDEMEFWFRENILRHKVHVDTDKADNVRWDRNNGIFADVLLRVDEDVGKDEFEKHPDQPPARQRLEPPIGIPIGPFSGNSRSPSRTRKPQRSVLFPAHRAMLIRSEYFATMFSSSFREAQSTEYLQIIPIDCSPDILQVILTYLYTERSDFPLDVAIDVLFAADLLFIDRLKVKAAQIISTLGNGTASIVESEKPRGETNIEDVIDIYDVMRAGWDTRVQRLEEFGARFIAYRLERYIDQEEFLELVKESAARVKQRQETDTIELIDDIRYYLSERFRLRFEDAGLDEMMDDETNDVPLDTADFDGTTLDIVPVPNGHEEVIQGGVIRTLDGEEAGDEFAQDALNYQILLNKIDSLLDQLKLDA